MSIRSPKFLAILLIIALTVPMFLAPTAAAPTAQAKMGDVKTASDASVAKIHPKLQAAVAAAALTDAINIMVYAKAGTDLSKYLDRLIVRPYVMPNGTQAYFGQLKAGQVSKLASLSEVAYVQEMKYSGDLPQLPEGPQGSRKPDTDALRARFQALKAAGPKVTVSKPAADKARIADWFDVLDVHKSKAAWDLGYTGEGVKVMVNDSGIDFSHPDLLDTLARQTDPASPYYGWPIAFDSFSMLALAYDYYLGTTYIKDGLAGSYAPDYADTSATRAGAALTTNADATLGATFAPIGSTDPAGHVYKFAATSKSGVYHFGSHPDTVLQKYYFDERAAILVVDEHTAGVYDTVYVDIDDDYDFTNDKPAVRGDEYIYKDLDGDGFADISGGNIYWISDGVNPLPVSDWLWGMGPDVAGPGNLVAFTIMDWSEPAGDHGQLCASAVAAQGVIDGGAPVTKPVGDGTPGTGLVQGGGKNAKLVAAGNHYISVDENEGYLFAAMGYDGLPGTEDDIQIISNSWGYSGTHNDGWDYLSRSIDSILRYINPSLSDMNSTGNGAAGYGTVTSPGDTLGISVGASTLYDSGANFDRPATMEQFNYNDSMSWSNRGPTAMGDNGVSVLANGAWGAGDFALTEVLDGWNAWEIWGGTSRSAPIAAGNLALVYQAFMGKNGRWPTNVEARAILMAGADKAYNDGFTEGAGTVNALRAAKIAAGEDGIYALPESWTAGDFRGTEYEAFSKIMYPGGAATKTFTVYNGGAADKTVQISDEQLVKIGSKEWDFTTANRTAETKVMYMPDYLFDVTSMIPAGTDMMEVKAVFPFAEFDPDGNYTANSSWRLVPMDWTDLNGDGKLWTDKNGNGAVNCAIVGGNPNFSDPACEIEGGEFNRFGYGYDRGTSLQQRVKQPLQRKHNGVFVALQHRSYSALVPVTHLKIQLNFYKMADFPWLTTDASVTVPAGGSATFDATMAVPALAGVGLYEGYIRLNDGANVSSIPVVANVAAWSTDFTFGGPPDSKSPYDNGQVLGYFDWDWRAEAGDWRFFFVDVPDGTPMGTSLLVDTRWSGANTDIDTLVMGPMEDCFSNGVGCAWPFEIFPGVQSVYGPYTLDVMGGSPDTNIGAGKWLYDTSTGGPREIVAAPTTPGLNVVALHNVMYDGSQPQERFTGQVGTIRATPDAVDMFVGNGTSGSFPVSVQSSLPLAGLQADAFGLGVPEKHLGLPQHQDDPNDPSTSFYTFPIAITHGAKLDVTMTGAAGDLDLFLLYDFNGDGNFNFGTEIVGSSTTSTANESVSVTMPPDGNYLAAVHGYAAAAATFDLVINAVQGADLSISGMPAGPFPPNTPINFTVNWAKTVPPGDAAEGLILAGPPGAPAALQIPVRLHNIVAASETMTLPAVADSYIASGFPTTNYGAEPFLFIGGNDVLRDVVKFDTTAINPIYPVQSAKLRLYVDAFGSTGQQHTLQALGPTKSWAENTVTWNTPWTVPGGDYGAVIASTTLSSANVDGWVELDVTDLAKSWVQTPSTNMGVLLKATPLSAYATFRFAGRQYWNAWQVPQLVVTYGLP
ncbi:MAG: DNRLRE domain-containing protein [Chloroflexi bacterium]|nr:DNRLRE domain-containing protein [Chloroflexota bacterium]